jgi:RNA-directed DNA polymerase
MSKIAEKVSDKRLVKLIRAFLTAGVLGNGLVNPVDEGTPQGGALSPLLSNIVLDEFDRELERRGLRFARYADDSNIYVRSRRAGERVMASITRFITTKLKLKVNEQKSAVARPWERKFLGFSFTSAGIPKRRIAPKAVDRFKERIRELTSRTKGVNIEQMAEELTRYLRGWIGYFGKWETPSVPEGLEQWFRRRLRSAIWKQWKRGSVRFAELRKRGVRKDLAAQTAGSAHGPWRLAKSPALSFALPNAYFDWLGIPRLTGRSLNPPNRRIRTRTYGGVTGKAGDSLPMSNVCRNAAQPVGGIASASSLWRIVEPTTNVMTLSEVTRR